MQRTLWLRSPVLIASLAAASTMALACNKQPNESPTSSARTPAPAAEKHETEPAPTPVSVTGCLQKGNRNTYIVTALNRPAHPDSSNPQVVAQEKQAAAQEAYRLTSGQTDDLKKLVGKRVHVEGTLKKAADAEVTGNTAGGTATTREIKQKDLAEVDVSSVKKVANTCGASSSRSKTHANRS
jgi:hypothetical protein